MHALFALTTHCWPLEQVEVLLCGAYVTVNQSINQSIWGIEIGLKHITPQASS